MPDAEATSNTVSPERRDEVRIPALQYWLVTSGGDGKFSPYQGFGYDILDPRFAELMEWSALLPASVAEIFAPAHALPSLRRPFTTKRTSIIGLPSFRLVLQEHLDDSSIHVVLGLSEDVKKARLVAQGRNFIFVSTASSDGVVGLDRYKGHRAQFLDEIIHQVACNIAPEASRSWLEKQPLRLPFAHSTVPSRGAGVTRPNEHLSTSLGFSYSGIHHIDGRFDGAYEQAILESIEHARGLMEMESTNVVLYAPSIARHLYDFGSAFWNGQFRQICSPEVRAYIKDGVFRNRGYSGYRVNVESGYEPPDLYSDPVAGSMLAMRQTELRLISAGMTALASSTMSPALRLPNAVNFHSAELRDIERFAMREDARGIGLLQKAFRQLSRKLSAETDERLLTYLRERTNSVTVVADAPLEWLPIDGLPLMLRHETSRIGMTPGNLMLTQCLESGVRAVHASALADVLVIRSFAATDPIKPALERALGVFDLQGLRVSFADAERIDDVIEHLNKFSGNILIFDCHGGHDGDEKNGWLRIGKEKLDTWQLAHIARVPPVVILSACSTFALAGSHASVGNGLIRSGALTVIGTFLPVDAEKSAAFVGRLLYRIKAFLPALQVSGVNFITWRSFVSAFLRMSYATDIIRFFTTERRWIVDAAGTDIHVQANTDINALREDWYPRLITNIAQAAQRTGETIVSELEDQRPLLETMLYCQIGRPDLLGIYLDTPEPSEREGDTDIETVTATKS
jgi:hypothetical protein